MPRAAARDFTAASNAFGKRILTLAVLRWNSNCTGRKPEKSYSDRSASSTNAADSASLRNVGKAFLVGIDFSSVHIRALMGRISRMLLRSRVVNTRNTARPSTPRPMARKRDSRGNGSAWTRSGRPNNASMACWVSRCFAHFARLPSSQSNPSNDVPSLKIALSIQLSTPRPAAGGAPSCCASRSDHAVTSPYSHCGQSMSSIHSSWCCKRRRSACSQSAFTMASPPSDTSHTTRGTGHTDPSRNSGA